MFVSRHVLFNETQFYYKEFPLAVSSSIVSPSLHLCHPISVFPFIIAQPTTATLPVLTTPNSNDFVFVSNVLPTDNSSASPIVSQAPQVPESDIMVQVPTTATDLALPTAATTVQNIEFQPSHRMETRSKTGHSRPKHYSYLLEHITELRSVKEELKSPQWLAVMQAEYDALLRNKTWSLVLLPPNREAISLANGFFG